MTEEQKQKQADFKQIIDGGGPRGALAIEVVQIMARYFELCGELNRRKNSVVSALMLPTTATIEAEAEYLDGLMGRLYAIVRDWEGAAE